MALHAHETKAPGAFKKRDLISADRDETHIKPFVEGKDLRDWYPARTRFLEYGTERSPALLSRPTFIEMYEVPEKIISMDISGATLRVAYDDKRVLHNHSAWSFILWQHLRGVRNRSLSDIAKYQDEMSEAEKVALKSREELEEISKSFDVLYLLGVMNSSSVRGWMLTHRRSRLHVYPDDWKPLQIPHAPHAQQQAIAALVRQCIDAKGVNCAEWEREIDARVAALYGL